MKSDQQTIPEPKIIQQSLRDRLWERSFQATVVEMPKALTQQLGF